MCSVLTASSDKLDPNRNNDPSLELSGGFLFFLDFAKADPPPVLLRRRAHGEVQPADVAPLLKEQFIKHPLYLLVPFFFLCDNI